MTQMSKYTPAGPKQAARCKRSIDRHLRPELFKALADPTRLRLLACLAKCARPCAVGELAQCCDVDLSVVSRHLALLHRADVIHAEKRGRVVYYTVNVADLAALFHALADALEECCLPSPTHDESGECCAR